MSHDRRLRVPGGTYFFTLRLRDPSSDLLVSHIDVLRDATDCSTAFLAGNLSLLGVDAKGNIDFGDDDGEWSKDGECDDMRFAGP